MSQPSPITTSSRTVSPVPTERNVDRDDDALQLACKDNSTAALRYEDHIEYDGFRLPLLAP